MTNAQKLIGYKLLLSEHCKQIIRDGRECKECMFYDSNICVRVDYWKPNNIPNIRRDLSNLFPEGIDIDATVHECYYGTIKNMNII